MFLFLLLFRFLDVAGLDGSDPILKLKFLKIKENNHHNSVDPPHTHTPPFLGIHSTGVDLDAAVQGRWLRDADRMEIQKCDRLTYRLTRVGA